MTKLKKIIISSAFFIIISIGLALIYNDMASFDNHKYYKQALEFYEEGDYQNAYYNFARVKRISPLYKISLLKQALCADNLKDYPTSIRKYNLFIKKYPSSLFIPKARYNLAKAYYYNNDKEEAKEKFEQIIKANLGEDFVIASNYYLGMIEKDTNKDISKAYFLEYIKKSPNGKFAYNCAKYLSKSKYTLNPEENFLIGKIYLLNNEYNNAEKFLENAPFEKAWSYLCICYDKSKKYKKLKQVFETGFSKCSNTVDKDSLKKAIDCFANTWESNPKQGWFYLSKIVQTNKSACEDYILFKLASYLDQPYKHALYNRVADKYPNSNYAAISLWNVFWSSYEAKNYEAAKKVMTRYFKACDNPAYNPKMLFWMGKTCLKLRKINEANGYFNKILTKYPDDYYAYRADAVLKHTESHWGLVSHHNIDERDFNIEFPIKYSNMDIKDFKLINMLLELGDYEIWKEVKFENKFVASWFKYKSGQKAESILLAKQGLDELDIKPPFNDDVYKLAYPIYWGDEINHYSTNYNLDSYLIISIIREESHFSPKSISRTGAVGLMQLMPSTASYIASKYDNISYHSRRELKNPNKNIELGTTYFTFIKTSLYNNVLAVAGYNGGPNAIKSWQIKNKYADLDEFVENIPYSETQTYVKKVYKSYWNYLNIYNY